MFSDVLNIFSKILNHLLELLSKVYGWLLIVVNSIVAYFLPEIACFAIVGVFILFDLVWGISAALKSGKFVLSSAFQDTFKKVGIYSFALAGAYLIESLIHENGFVGIKVLAVMASCCELWSMSANMLIVKPNMPFLHIFRLQLKGEIENKTGKNLDHIFKEKEDENKQQRN
jgi:Holin family.